MRVSALLSLLLVSLLIGVDPAQPQSLVEGREVSLLNLPQEGGYLVKTVEKGSLGDLLGLRAGDRTATIDGQEIVLGGDTILTAQGIDLITIDDLIEAAKRIRDQPPGREVRMRVLRAGTAVELTAVWSGAN